jgi:hypothetical protein
MSRNHIVFCLGRALTLIPSPPTGEREGPNAKHWEGEGERTAIFLCMLQKTQRRFPLTLALSPAGGEGIFRKGGGR